VTESRGLLLDGGANQKFDWQINDPNS
jgi:hypothetical protein